MKRRSERRVARARQNLALSEEAVRLNAELRQERKDKREAERVERKVELDDRLQAQGKKKLEALKTKARRSFLSAGGDPDDFDERWEKKLLPAILQQAVIEGVARGPGQVDF